MYNVYLDDIRFPVAPSAITIRDGGRSETFKLMDGNEICVPSLSGLHVINLEVLLPAVDYGFALYNDGFLKPSVFIKAIKEIKDKGRAVRLVIERKNYRDKKLFNTSYTIVVDDYMFSESADNGLDTIMQITLRQYKTMKIKKINTEAFKSASVSRPNESKPVYASHSVVKGDSLWALAYKYLGDGSRYKDLYDWNKAIIDAGNYGTSNTTYTIYPKQVLIVSR